MKNLTPYETPRLTVWGGSAEGPANPDMEQAWDSSDDDEQIATLAYCLGEMYPCGAYSN